MADDIERLHEARENLARIDQEVLELASKRIALARSIAALKAEHGLATVDFAQEAVVLARAKEHAAALSLDPKAAELIMLLLIQSAVTEQEQERIRSNATGQGRTAVVVGGSGRIGSWMVRFLEAQGHDVHVHDPATDQDVSHLVPDADLVVMATPPRIAAQYYQQWETAPSGLLLDVASIKAPLIEGIRHMQALGAKVASIHPMFGPDVRLLRDLDVVLVDTGDPAAMDGARALFADTTARIVEVPLEQHDAWMADVLGLAHAVSLAFAHALPEHPLPVRSQTLGALRDIAAAVVNESPDVYFEIQAHNPHAHAALERLNESIRALDDIVGREDRDAFAAYMADGRARLHATEVP